ncbi:MAG TPA: GDP-mannose 4,6-dehydratase, partial [Chthonomonadales bacterium]|nr:GDP-mannose 4,6-dehydratase [Chthonomonadales bacterium]
RSASSNLWRLEELGIAAKVKLVPLDLLEFSNIQRVIETTRPDEIYNLAAQSYVAASFEQPIYTADVDALGALRVLEAIRLVKPDTRFYQASTSEMFGKTVTAPQNEQTPFYPRSPYGASKLFAHWATVNYREAYGLHASSGILFNHEGPLRGMDFVTRKITAGLACIKHGRQEPVELGNLESRRDWGFAGDYVRGMYQMLQLESGGEYVLATGQTHSIQQFVECAATAAGFDMEWSGEAEQTRATDRRTGNCIVRVNPAFYRPSEVDALQGDAGKARRDLGWAPEVDFEALVELMIKADMNRAASGVPLA